MIEKYINQVSLIIGPPDKAIYIDAAPDITCSPALRDSIRHSLAEHLEAGFNTFVACRQTPFTLEVARMIKECFSLNYPSARCIYFNFWRNNPVKAREYFDIKTVELDGVFRYKGLSLLLLSCVGEVLCAVPTCKLETSLLIKRALKKGVPYDNVWSEDNIVAQVLAALQKNAAYHQYCDQIRALCTGLDPQRVESLFDQLLGVQGLIIDLLSALTDDIGSTP